MRKLKHTWKLLGLTQYDIARRSGFYVRESRSRKLRQQIAQSFAAMMARYTGVVPIEQIRADFSRRNGPKIAVSEIKKTVK